MNKGLVRVASNQEEIQIPKEIKESVVELRRNIQESNGWASSTAKAWYEIIAQEMIDSGIDSGQVYSWLRNSLIAGMMEQERNHYREVYGVID